VSITVLKPGLHTMLQDSGRHGHQHFGVPVGGAMDLFSHRIANIVAGNRHDLATLEIMLQGPHLAFSDHALIAICGADLSPTIAGEPVPEGKAVRVRAGSVLEFGACRAGCRGYLAVNGGFDVPMVMGSRSTYEPARFGGLEGRALAKGDKLETGIASPDLYPGLTSELEHSRKAFACPKWSVNQHIEKLDRVPQVVRIVPGRHWEHFTAESLERLTSSVFRIAPESNRMGFRLQGSSLALEKPFDMLSEAVSFGTIQVPPGGQPIVLMADRQTTGGYPRIAEVASVDLHLLAQLRPGDGVRFELVSLAQAQALHLCREQEMVTIREAVEQHMTL
jgi:antagonist of KipI